MCEDGKQCASGCCGAEEEGGVKLCREYCRDEFNNELFQPDYTDSGDRGWECLPDGAKAGIIIGGVAYLLIFLCAVVVPIIGCICVCLTCSESSNQQLQI